MEFRVLGPLEVRDGDRTIRVGGGRRRALLALLLMHRNEVVPAERLIDELWDGEPPPTAAKGLQVHISHLRKELAACDDGDGMLRTRPPGYVLEVGPEDVDAVRFERGLDEAVRARADGRPGKAADCLQGALALWRGPPLVDFAYDRFARAEIARLGELHLLALEERVDAELALARHREVLAELEQLVAAHPSRERLRALLMVALYRSGRRAEALDVYRDGRARSVDELGIELGPELRTLLQAVLTDDPSLAAPPRGAARPSTRAASVLLLAAALLAGAAAAAFVLEDRSGNEPGAPTLDLVRNSIAALDAGGRPAFGVVLPGRPADIAADGDRLYAVTADAPTLTIADARTRRVRRTVPLRMRPAAVGVGPGGVWVVDGSRGLAVRFDATGGRVLSRVRWRRETAGTGRTAVAVAGGSAWIASGSPTLVRAGVTGALRRTRLSYAADGLAAGAGAVWAFSHRRALIMRLDVRTGRTTDVIRLAGHAGSNTPQPTAVAADGSSVWVLSRNIATLTRIDAGTRGVIATFRLPPERSPRDVAAAAGAVWVACQDGSVVRVSDRGTVRTTSARGSLVGVAGSGRMAWIAARGLGE